MNSKSDGDTEQHNFVFRSRDEMAQSLSKMCYGNLFVLGSIWIELMKKIMIGKRMCVVPKIYNNKNIISAKQEEIAHGAPEAYSEKTYKKKPVDLPTDNSRPALNEFDLRKWYWTKNKETVVHNYLLPYVKNAKMTLLEKWQDNEYNISETLYASKNIAENKISKVIETIRNPNNRVKEKACISLSVAAGVLIGSRRGFRIAILNGGLGALVSGWLCFRKKSDEVFRDILFKAMVTDDKEN